jgi:hypothetical protein
MSTNKPFAPTILVGAIFILTAALLFVLSRSAVNERRLAKTATALSIQFERLRSEPESHSEAKSEHFPRAQMSELMRLRGEVGVLRQLLAEAQLQTPHRNVSHDRETTVSPQSSWMMHAQKLHDHWNYIGHSTPEATIETVLWAAATGDTNTFLNSILWEGTTEADQVALAAPSIRAFAELAAVTLADMKELARDEVQAGLLLHDPEERVMARTLALRKMNGQWLINWKEMIPAKKQHEIEQRVLEELGRAGRPVSVSH